ncbi:uncharacterized protein LOC103315654 [Nasonia vitripennis]|uniref:Uncharacterized protein n=1 Tax=Nasonia vitripennis TaxID=7425 RepID=A0A7M7Q9S0_NASVI|nr:uncharacterized protein LOC103315654 [Nasonia vitripennis]
MSTINGPTTSNLSINNFKGIDADIARIIWSKLGTSPKVSMSEQGYIDEQGKPHGALVHLVFNQCDMGMNQLFFRDFWRLETYPHGYAKIFALSRELNYESTVASLPKILETYVISTLVVICMLVTLYLKYLLKIDIASASFKTLKMLLGMGIGKIPRGTMNRINFTFLFLFMFSMNIYLQSMLTSSLAAPENKFYIDDKEDLEAVIPDKYTISGPAYIKEFLDNKTIAPHLISSSFQDCISKIHINSNYVCLADSVLISDQAKSHKNIHISRVGIENVQLTFVTREDWPLRKRINELMQRLRETGIMTNMMIKEQIKSHFTLYVQTQDYNSTDSNLKRLTLESLKFDLYILAIGNYLSLVLLIIEKTLSKLYHKKRIDNLKIFRQTNAVANH